VARGLRNAARCLALALVLAALLTAAVSSPGLAEASRSAVRRQCAGADVDPAQASLHFLRSSVLCLVNRVREHYGLDRLHYNPDLRRSATGHSNDMVANGYFSHFGPAGSTPSGRITRAGYLTRARSYFLGEDLAGGEGRRYGAPLAIFRAWMHSPPHRANILNPRFHDVGVGVARGFPLGGGRNSATYTIDFGTRS
jgi:uncharacterized protein YkwD